MRMKALSGKLVLPLLLLVALDASGAAVGLVDAIKSGDKAAIRTLLQQRVDVNASEPDGTTALHWAARVNDLQTAESLIRARANIKATNRYGVTPLYLASINGNAAMIELLLKSGADPNAALAEGETALMTASRTGKVDAVKVLLARGADINAKEKERGQSALMWAAAEGNADVIRLLIANGADKAARSNGGFTAFLFAAREGRIAAAKAFLEAGVSINESLTPRAGGGGGRGGGGGGGGRGGGATEPTATPAVPATPNAFLLAAANAHYELASFLLDAGADPNHAPQGFTALHQVSWVRKVGVGDNDPAPPGSGNIGSLDFVRKLAAKGANLNARVSRRPQMGTTTLNSIGATPFLLAARTKDVELMRVLAELGANPLLTNDDGTTPLMVAAGIGTSSPQEDPGIEPEVLASVKLALELGGDINAIDKNGETAMHGAAYKHVPSVVRFLAEKGAKMEVWNQPNKRGWTPLRIVEGIPVGMNIAGDAATRAAIREVMAKANAR
jgi:ankyrin repeat protein